MMRRLLSACALICATHMSTTGVSANEATMIVFDASGSMWGQIDGVNKIVTARDVVRETLGDSTRKGAIGLVAYGHNRKGDCADIEMLVPPSNTDTSRVVEAVAAITPRGKTPLTDAVRMAAKAMRHTEQPATVVLITDGLETCGSDPCALARELEQTGVAFTAHVVGFGLSAKDGAAVSCLADETGGRYFEADNKDELAAALSLAVVEKITPQTIIKDPPQIEPKHNLQINVQLSPDSPPLEQGEIDKLILDLIPQPDGATKNIGYSPVMAVKVAQGEYILRAKYAGGQSDLPISVQQFDTTHATVALDAGVVDFRGIQLSTDLFPPEIISWRITNVDTGERHERYKPDLRAVFKAGTYDVAVILGRKDALSPAPMRVKIEAGEVSEGEILLPHGALRVDNVSDTGERLPDHFMRFGLWTARDDGTPENLVMLANGTRHPLLSLPGDYLLVAEDWGIGKRKYIQPISIRPGVLDTLRIVMPSDPAAPMAVVQQ